MAVKETIACGVVECLGWLWKSKEFCDFTIIVDDERIQCHRNVLCACSEFFRGLLNSEMKEQKEGCVTIPNITKATMDVILNSVYTGKDGLTIENVTDVWHASHQLQIRFMIKECENFVMKNIHTENYLAIYEHAKLLQSADVIKFIHDFMMKNFEHFHQTETFLNLPVDILHSMVDSQDLVVSSENLVVESILKWICFNPHPVPPSKGNSNDGVDNVNNKKDNSCSNNDGVENNDNICINNTVSESGNVTREGHLTKLLSASRLYLCTPGFLETFRNNKLACSCPSSLSMIVDVLMQNLNPGRHNDCWPSQAVHRNCSSRQVGLCYALIIQTQNLRFYFYSFLENKVFTICDLDIEVKEDFSITVFNNDIFCFSSDLYVLGRNKERIQAIKLQENLNKQMQSGFSASLYFYRTKLLSHGNYIYVSVIQGSNYYRQYNISLYELKINSSTDKICNLCLEVSEQKLEYSLVSCGRYILLFAQNSTAKTDNTPVTCYDPEKQTKRKLDDIEGTPQNIISFCVEKQVYVLQENGSLWKAVNCYDETDTLDLQFVDKLWDFTWPVYGAVFYRGQLYLFGHTLDAGSGNKLPLTLPGVFDRIQTVQLNTAATTFFPMFAPKFWLQELKKK